MPSAMPANATASAAATTLPGALLEKLADELTIVALGGDPKLALERLGQALASALCPREPSAALPVWVGSGARQGDAGSSTTITTTTNTGCAISTPPQSGSSLSSTVFNCAAA